MEWKLYINKKIFVKLKDGAVYSNSEILECDESSIPNDVLITIKDRDGKLVSFWQSEIYKIKEEGE